MNIHPGEILKDTMIAYKISQTELAIQTGISRKQVNRIINGRALISVKFAVKLSQVFDISAEFWVSLSVSYLLKKQLSSKQGET